MPKKWRVDENDGYLAILVEDETNELIAHVISTTPDELELIRKAPELLNAAHDAYDELVLHEKMARSTGDEGLLAVVEKLRGLLF